MARTNNKVAPRLYVTERMLERNGACSRAREEFRQIFGVGRDDKVFFTKANAEKIRGSEWMTLAWLASRVLPDEDYNKAWEACAWRDVDVPSDIHYFRALEAHRKSLAVSR